MTGIVYTLVLNSLLSGISFADNPGKHIEVQFLPAQVSEKNDHVMDHKDSHHKMQGHGALPLQQFMRLFPLDIPAKAHIKVIHIGGHPGRGGGDPVADIIGDQIINSILSELSQGFHSEMKPLLAGLNSVARGEPHPCEADILKYCQEDHGHGHKHESELHCLGLHANDLSVGCAKEVQQSVPFMCSLEISHYCPAEKTIEISVLQCLEDKLDAGENLGDDCKDSLSATRAVVTKMKTQSVAIVDKRTGAIIRSPGSALAIPLYISAVVILIGALGLLLYAFWVRDDETSFFKSVTRTFRELRLRMKGRGKSQQHEPIKTVELKSNYL
jgi:hypothetical protein